MAEPLISIALCTYNGEKYLKHQLDSLVNQTYKNLEIIAFDDCSTDNTFSILKSYKEKFTNFNIFQNEHNIGYVKNFERAIIHCKGEYIALSDQDDVWDLDKITILYKEIGNNTLIYHDSKLVNEQGENLQIKLSDIRNFYKGKDPRVFLLDNCVSGHAILFKNELIKHALPFDKNIFHDWWLAYLATSLNGITYIENVLVKYRQHNLSSTDILSQKQEKLKNYYELESFKKDIYRIEFFESNTKTKFSSFNIKLINLLNRRLKKTLSPTIWIFLLKNKNILFYIRKKSYISKLNLTFKYFFGPKIKKR